MISKCSILCDTSGVLIEWRLKYSLFYLSSQKKAILGYNNNIYPSMFSLSLKSFHMIHTTILYLKETLSV